jgi:hypothetical protein
MLVVALLVSISAHPEHLAHAVDQAKGLQLAPRARHRFQLAGMQCWVPAGATSSGRRAIVDTATGNPQMGSQIDLTSERGHMTPSSPGFATPTTLGMAADTASYRNR